MITWAMSINLILRPGGGKNPHQYNVILYKAWEKKLTSKPNCSGSFPSSAEATSVGVNTWKPVSEDKGMTVVHYVVVMLEKEENNKFRFGSVGV